MELLINLYNQTGAGPKNISLNLIEGLEKRALNDKVYIIVPDYAEYAKLSSNNPQLQLIKYPRKQDIFSKVWFRVFLELWLIPKLIKKYRISHLLAFGNFLFTPGKFTKLVLCHHPYLYDDNLLAKSHLPIKLVEYLKRVAFAFTLLNVNHIVTQSPHVAEQLCATWRLARGKKIHCIPNPISSNFQQVSSNELQSLIKQREIEGDRLLKLLFVSRYYPHKNHRFLIRLSKALLTRQVPHQIVITVDPKIKDAKIFLQDIKREALPIINLEEVDQHRLAKAYQQACMFIFPSRSETFGNPLIEAMSFGLPLILPKLGYAEAIAGGGGNYYPPEDENACIDTILSLHHDKMAYQHRSLDAYSAFLRFPNVDQWVDRYLRTLTSDLENK